MADKGGGEWIVLGIGAVVAYYLWQNGTLAEWFPTIFAPAVPATSTVATAVTPATVALASTVTLNSASNSLAAQVNINGTPQPVSIGISTGVAEDGSGNNITAALQALGVNISSLLAMMQAAYSTQQTGVSGLSGNRMPFGLIHGGLSR
jgi:hypothetical protein